MVFRGKPSKACERCRARRLRVSPKSGNHPSLELRFDFGCSVIFTVALVANALEPVCLVQDTGIHSSFGFKMKASLL
jgi:hypothetical protein